jgi:hypothetical protein
VSGLVSRGAVATSAITLRHQGDRRSGSIPLADSETME